MSDVIAFFFKFNSNLILHFNDVETCKIVTLYVNYSVNAMAFKSRRPVIALAMEAFKHGSCLAGDRRIISRNTFKRRGGISHRRKSPVFIAEHRIVACLLFTSCSIKCK